MNRTDQDQAPIEPGRRRFIAVAGAGLAAAGLLNISDAFAARGARVMGAGAVNLGSGDVGVLNYAYALEQLEAAFYTLVLAHPYAGMTAYDRALLSDIRSHEVAHVRFLRGALGSARIPDLDVDFSSVDFTKRGSVLTTAQTFEDLGVAAYNGAGKLLKDPAHLLAAGTIVSVEARHAAMLHDLMAPLTDGFGGHPNGLGLDGESSPSSVLASASPFVRTRIDASQIG